MLGAIIGDIVGSRFEFDNTDNYNFELFTKDSTFTDDTICTIAVADAINTGANYGDKFLQWCRGIPQSERSIRWQLCPLDSLRQPTTI